MTGRLHILVVNVFFAPHTYGGATIVAEEMARRLVADHGMTVSAISVMRRSDLAPYSVIRSEVDGIASWLINLPPDQSYVGGYLNPFVGDQVARIVHEIEPDLAHVHCVQDVGADCLSRLEAAKVPVILSVHDFWWLCERQFMLRPDGSFCGQSPIKIAACRGCVDDIGRARSRQRQLLALADVADVVTYPSQYARDLCEGSGLAAGKGRVWENGVRIPGAEFFDRQAARRASDARTVFGFVGGPSRIKGWPLLHEAFAGLDRSDIRGLVVDGSLDGSWWRDRPLDAMAGDWSVHPRYSQKTMDDFFSKIDVLLYLSQWKETFGLTIREALARGIQVIQTDSGGSVEHQAFGPEKMLKIGDGPVALREKILAAVSQPRGAAVVPVVDQAKQAVEFVALAREVLSRRSGATRAAA